jgi:hypothetical protein
MYALATDDSPETEQAVNDLLTAANNLKDGNWSDATSLLQNLLNSSAAECTVFAATIAISSAFLPLVASLTTVAVPTIVLSVFSMA